MNTTSGPEVRELGAAELDTVTGGVISTIFQYGNLKVDIWASRDEYAVCTTRGGHTTCTIVSTTD